MLLNFLTSKYWAEFCGNFLYDRLLIYHQQLMKFMWDHRSIICNCVFAARAACSCHSDALSWRLVAPQPPWSVCSRCCCWWTSMPDLTKSRTSFTRARTSSAPSCSTHHTATLSRRLLYLILSSKVKHSTNFIFENFCVLQFLFILSSPLWYSDTIQQINCLHKLK